jgi:hypothetical protein
MDEAKKTKLSKFEYTNVSEIIHVFANTFAKIRTASSSRGWGKDTAYCTDCKRNGRVAIDPKTIVFWVPVRLLWIVKTELSMLSHSQITQCGNPACDDTME